MLYPRSLNATPERTDGVVLTYVRRSRPTKELVIDENGKIREITLSPEDTLKKQKEMLESTAEAMNLKVVEVFEEVVSASTIADRPEVNRLLDYVASGSYNGLPIMGVLCKNVTRLARGETRDQGDILEIFEVTGIKIITPRKIYDPRDPADYKYLEFEFFMARQEWSLINERMQDDKFADVTEGQYLGSVAPYGYDRIRIGDIKTLEANDDAEIVIEMFRWGVEDGLSVCQIQRKLNELMVPTPRGSTEWSYQIVDKIMRNEHYIGKIVWGKCRSVKQIKPGTRQTEKKRVYYDDYLIVDGLHQPIIPEETFYAFQSRHPKKEKARRDYGLANKLAGLLVCRECGKRIKREVTRTMYGVYPRYTHITSKYCHCKGTSYEKVLELVAQGLMDEVRELEFEQRAGGNQNAVREHEARVAALDKELAAVSKAKTSLWDRFDGLSKSIPQAEFEERMTYLSQKEQKLREDRVELLREKPREVQYGAKILSLKKAVGMILDDDADIEATNDFLKEIVHVIKYWNDAERGEDDIELTIVLK